MYSLVIASTLFVKFHKEIGNLCEFEDLNQQVHLQKRDVKVTWYNHTVTACWDTVGMNVFFLSLFIVPVQECER